MSASEAAACNPAKRTANISAKIFLENLFKIVYFALVSISLPDLLPLHLHIRDIYLPSLSMAAATCSLIYFV
jgi:hypothetical protein